MQRPVHKMFEVQNALHQELIAQVIPGTPGQTFHDISTWEDFWEWTDEVLVEKVYGESYWPDPNGDAARAPYSLFTVGKYNRVLSAIRFRQVRVRPTLPRCTHNSFGILPSEFEMACSREDTIDQENSCNTPLDSHTLSRPCWGFWSAEHQEREYPGAFEKASSKITLDKDTPQWNLLCEENCEAYYVQGYRTADEHEAFGIQGVTDFLVSFDIYVSPLTALAKCKEACDVSGSRLIGGLSDLHGMNGNPDYCGIGDGGCYGDVVDLPLNRSETLRRIAAMKRERWTSESTRAVVVEVNTYNPNYDVAAVVRLVVDANPGGLLEPHFETVSCNLGVTGTTMDTFRSVLEILFAGWLVYYFLIEVSDMYYHKWKYFADVWNYIELANIVGYIYSMMVWWMYVHGHNFDTYRKRDPNEFKDVLTVAKEFNANAAVSSCCILVMCMRSFKYSRLSAKFRMFWDTLRAGVQIFVPLSLVFVALILGFTCSGHWLFGHRMRTFSSMSSAFMYLLLSVKDGIDLAAMQAACPPAVALVWYFAWYLISKIIVPGLFVAASIGVFGKMLHEAQVADQAHIDAVKRGAKIPRLRDYVLLNCPLPLVWLPGVGSKNEIENQENNRELKETMQEIDLDMLWERGIKGLLDNELALDAAELTFLFGGEQDKTAAKSARHFINRLCNLASLQSTSVRTTTTSILDEVSGLEAKAERMVTHLHGCRKALEKRFHKLRPYIAKQRDKMMQLERIKTTGVAPLGRDEDRHFRYVFKEGMHIGEIYYLVEMSTVGQEMHISAYDAAHERTLDLMFKDERYERLLSEAAWDYSNVAQRLRHGSVLLSDSEGDYFSLELGPRQQHVTPSAKPLQSSAVARPKNCVFPGGADGPEPPQRGQLKVAAAVLHSQRQGTPLSVKLVDISSRPVLQEFLKAEALQRVE